MRHVPPVDWVTELTECRAVGFDMLDMITGVDRLDSIEVIASVMRSSDGVIELISTRLGADHSVATVVPVYAGASWYERELAEMFGVIVTGAADVRPLLRRTDQGAPMLLKSTVLATRVLTPWPGDADDEANAKSNRRRQRAVGVTDGWLVEDGGAND